MFFRKSKSDGSVNEVSEQAVRAHLKSISRNIDRMIDAHKRGLGEFEVETQFAIYYSEAKHANSN